MTQTKKGDPGPPGWGLGVKLTTSPRKKLLQNLKKTEEAKTQPAL